MLISTVPKLQFLCGCTLKGCKNANILKVSGSDDSQPSVTENTECQLS